MSVLPWAIVTGASGGLGGALARDLAARKHNLVLTARSIEALERLAADLRAGHGIDVRIEPLDLSVGGSAAELFARLEAADVFPDVLINNAAFGMTGPFLDHDIDRLRSMLQLDIVTVTELTHLLGRRMANRGRGKILFVASLAAFQPNPMMAAYGAAKAYIISFAEALNVELAPTVSVTVVSPGLMDTGFNAASGFTTPKSMQRTVLLPSDVSKIALKALFDDRSGVVAGKFNAIAAFSSRLFSRHFSAKTAYRMSQSEKKERNG